MLELYKKQTKILVALDSIIFGFNGDELKILLVKRGLEQHAETWSLMGGWLTPEESLNEAADRILLELTGLKNVYLEQLATFGNPKRDSVTRTVSVTYKALININDYVISEDIEAEWFSLKKLPRLLFDHYDMVMLAIERLRTNAAFLPVGFELLPTRFTLPQLQNLYEAIFDEKFDKRNFSRKILKTGYLIKTDEKQKGFSKKGAFFYEFDRNKLTNNEGLNFKFSNDLERFL